MASPKIIPGSERPAPAGAPAGPVDAGGQAEISIYLRCAPAGKAQDGAVDRRQLRQAREAALAPAVARVTAFASAHGLTVTDQDPARRLLKVSGSLADLQAAFGTELRMFDHPKGPFRARSGPLYAPADVVDDIEAVLGLDQRPIATPKSVRVASPRADAGYLPNAVAKLYGFPDTGRGSGQTVALIELGGGVSASDTAAAFQAMGLQPPDVESISVDGAKTASGQDQDADGEVALDVQVVGGAAPAAAIAVYFAPNTDQGFVDAITQAAHDETRKPSTMSISWGSAESGWTAQAVTAMNSALQDADALGVSVFVASGDGLATDGVGDGKAHVDFPASSPWAVGCGGTRLAGDPARDPESVWNSNGGGAGGGISDLFAVPDYQAALDLPANVSDPGRKGRGVPDVAGDADPDTGYRVVVDGQGQVIGGTSAVAPLWAGLFALAAEAAGAPLGAPHAQLYAHPEAFNDVLTGDNMSGGIGYSATKGWDACTGLGSPKAAAIVALFGAKPPT